jgi:hypothetical protein
MGTSKTGIGIAFVLSLTIAGMLVGPGGSILGIAKADQLPDAPSPRQERANAAFDDTGAYHTPLAGEPFHTDFLGRSIDIVARDRGHVTALLLGGVLYTPKQGDTYLTPIGALYVRRMWEKSRTRDVIGVFVNDLEYDRNIGRIELVTRFQNNTIPIGQREIVNNQEIASSDVVWGTAVASVGPGLRYKVSPFQVDNDLRLQLLGRVGYFYAHRTSDTGPEQVLPPDTVLYGVKLRGRYDGLRRNLLELAHAGMAAGFDLDFMHRDKWADFGTRPDGIVSKGDTQNYFRLSGYYLAVGGIPGLSEKNRLVFTLHAGSSLRTGSDRYNAVWIGGDPIPDESDDLSRIDYPSAMYNHVPVSNYALAELEYRRELAFFLYLQLRETFIWADRAVVTATNQYLFKSSTGAATSLGLVSGFYWRSELTLGFSWDTGFIRNGKPGSGLIVTWSKAL